jgi:hypothetical protein
MRVATFPAPCPAGEPLARPRARRLLALALALSAAVHLALSLWPVTPPALPDDTPLQASITQMPPPPRLATAIARPAPRPKPRRTAQPPAPQSVPVVATETATDAVAETMEPTADALATGPESPAPPPELATTEPPTPPASTLDKTLPARVDLVYKAFLGTRGFLIGEAVYRFEHADNQYRIATVGEARGIAALLLRGQGRLESHGNITANGLQPLEFSIERGSRERRETALFDWETGLVMLHEQKTEALDLPTFDPLTVMWHFYFSPPVDDRFGFAVATTRRVARYQFVREGNETITWSAGAIEAQRWRRKSEDGKTEALVWLAPGLNYVPVKMRVSNTDRGTVEALLDSIRVDEKLAQQ